MGSLSKKLVLSPLLGLMMIMMFCAGLFNAFYSFGRRQVDSALIYEGCHIAL